MVQCNSSIIECYSINFNRITALDFTHAIQFDLDRPITRRRMRHTYSNIILTNDTFSCLMVD